MEESRKPPSNGQKAAENCFRCDQNCLIGDRLDHCATAPPLGPMAVFYLFNNKLTNIIIIIIDGSVDFLSPVVAVDSNKGQAK